MMNVCTCMVCCTCYYYVSIDEVRLSIELISLCFIGGVHINKNSVVIRLPSEYNTERKRGMPYSPLSIRNIRYLVYPTFYHFHTEANSFPLTTFNLHPIKFSGSLLHAPNNGPPIFPIIS